MDIQKFVKTRPIVFHLTNRSNLDSIIESRVLYSTAKLVETANLADQREFLRTRRRGCTEIGNGALKFHIRDQDPLFETVINKCLEKGMDFGDYVHLLNTKVFFWPTEKDLLGHYKRYEKLKENVVILKIETSALFQANRVSPKFCRLNSGAPRPSSRHKGKGAPRGRNTFLAAEDYPGTPSSIREVTFELSCKLPEVISVSRSPFRNFKKV